MQISGFLTTQLILYWMTVLLVCNTINGDYGKSSELFLKMQIVAMISIKLEGKKNDHTIHSEMPLQHGNELKIVQILFKLLL